MKKTEKSYWDSNYETKNTKPKEVPKDHPIRKWISSHLVSVDNKNCIEIGCYPGRFLTMFGELGYELNGIDYTERVDQVPTWLKSEGYKVGEFYYEDFFKWNSSKQYDLVYSLGFIEHFTEFKDVIKSHCDMVANNGYLILEVPNFIGRFQFWIHSKFDKENLNRHHVPAMDISDWLPVLEENGFEIIDSRYFGSFHFWVEHEERSFFQRGCLKIIRTLKPLLAKILPDDRKAYSPFCGVIAKRRYLE